MANEQKSTGTTGTEILELNSDEFTNSLVQMAFDIDKIIETDLDSSQFIDKLSRKFIINVLKLVGFDSMADALILSILYKRKNILSSIIEHSYPNIGSISDNITKYAELNTMFFMLYDKIETYMDELIDMDESLVLNDNISDKVTYKDRMLKHAMSALKLSLDAYHEGHRNSAAAELSNQLN